MNTRALERLADLHSAAVDYPKTGMPVPKHDIPGSRIHEKPDWSKPEISDGDTSLYYESQRWIGRLFRRIELPQLPQDSKSQAPPAFGFPPWEHVLNVFQKNKFPRNDRVEEAIRLQITPYVVSPYRYSMDRIKPIWSCYKAYVSSLRTICANFTLAQRSTDMLTEEEVVLGTIVALSSQPRMRKDRMAKMQEQVALLVSRTIKQILASDEKSNVKVLKRAWVAFRVSTVQPKTFGSRSFGLIAMRVLFDALQNLVDPASPVAYS